jgi:hypothetical protein
MRYKGLSVCLIALFVFFGLRSLMRTVEPKTPSRLAMLEDGTRSAPSHNHLASLASLAAGALAFAVIPGPARRKTKRPSAPRSATPTPAQESVVRCPQCDRTMNRVLINNGEHRGRAVWICPQSPNCEVRPLTRRRRLSFLHHAS